MTKPCKHPNARLAEGWQYSLWDLETGVIEQTAPTLVWVLADCPDCTLFKTYYAAHLPGWLRDLRRERLAKALDAVAR